MISVADTPHRSSPSPLLRFSPNRAMEEKNPDNHIDDAPGAISDTRGPAVEKRIRDYDHVAENVAPTREYTLSHSRIIAERQF